MLAVPGPFDMRWNRRYHDPMDTIRDKLSLSTADAQRLDEYYRELEKEACRFVGYPANGRFDYSDLHRFLRFPLNNVGDPFVESTYRVNSCEFEQEVLHYFARLYHAPKSQYWGYVTSGGTEGNMYGLYLARELLPHGVVYYSEDTHYSVSKVLRVLALRNIMIKAQPSGEIDYEDLRETVRIHRDVPPIILANIGTTMKGAVDDVARIREILHDFAVPDFYIHCDAALSGMILPFVKDPPPYDFGAGIDSLSVSGHKMIGSPIPCGIVLAMKKNVERIARSIEYVGTLDTTISGSRNGLSPLFLWAAIRRLGRAGFREMVAGCLRMADYAIERFEAAGIAAWRNKSSVTVVFPRPPAPVVEKWQIAVFRDIAHIITMPHVTRQHVDELVEDIVSTKS